LLRWFIFGRAPIESWYSAITWLALVAAVGYLMVSTWRFYSFKDIDFRSRHPFRLIILLAAVFRPGLVLLAAGAVCGCAAVYILGGILALAVDLPPPQASLRHQPFIRRLRNFMSSPSKIARVRPGPFCARAACSARPS
jgi:phosphatidylserine synthase